MTSSARHDLSHLPPAGPDEIRAMLKAAGIDLPEDLLAQFVAAWPAYEAMVRRIPRRRAYGEEPAHVFRPERLMGG
ncbi:MAG: hypothetical protein ACM3JG_21015 [Thiohalocapsa sp.]